jgi:hypothetical protein
MKIYCIINSNYEGYNIIGIYDSKDQAALECETINKQIREEQKELNIYERERGGDFDFTKSDWDHCHVVAWGLNTRKPHTRKDYDALQDTLDE